MQLRSLLERPTLMTLLGLFIGLGFLLTTLASYYVSRQTIHNSILTIELPLTAQNIYLEIQRDLVQPVDVASSMAADALLADWIKQGERNVPLIARYLSHIKQQYKTSTAFLVSDQTKIYYSEDGALSTVQLGEKASDWYYRFKDSGAPWDVVVDVDRSTMFINYRVVGDDGSFLGAVGVGISLDQLFRLIDSYERRYERNVYFVDTQRRIVVTGTEGGPGGAPRGTPLADLPALAEVDSRLPEISEGSFEYQHESEQHFLTIRYIPELSWYLFVDRSEAGALAPLRRTLWLNLLICLLVTAVVLSLVGIVTRRYLQRIEALATHDALTELLNRRGFSLVAEQALLEARRQRSTLCVLLFDIDHFKTFNDTHGHLGGDFLLRSLSAFLRQQGRKSDIVSRWGGEEFVMVLKDTSLQDAADFADKLRARIDAQPFDFNDVPLHVTVSMGLAQMTANDTLDTLINRADQALYRAKRQGRNRVVVDQVAP